MTFLLPSSSGERTETPPIGQNPEPPGCFAAGGPPESQEERYRTGWLLRSGTTVVFFSLLTSTSSVPQGRPAAWPTEPAAAPSTPLPWHLSPNVLTVARRPTSPSRTWWLWGGAERVSTTTSTSSTAVDAPPRRRHPPPLPPTSQHRRGWRSCTSSPV